MLEKIKELLGDAFTEELGAALLGVLSADFISKADHDAAVAPLSDLEAQLKVANETIAGYKDMDIDAIKKSAEDWKAAAEKAELDAAEKISGMKFNAALSKAIGAAKGKNEKAITALLDIEALKSSKNQEADINAAIAAAQKDADYMFGDTTPAQPFYASGTGSAPVYVNQDNKMMADARAAAGIM